MASQDIVFLFDRNDLQNLPPKMRDSSRTDEGAARVTRRGGLPAARERPGHAMRGIDPHP